jgi:hypothetical protein
MYYYTTANQQNGNMTIFAMAKTLKQAAAKLSKQQKFWPDTYYDGMMITVCKKSRNGNMQWHGDYQFIDGKLKLHQKPSFDFAQWGLV